MISFKALGNYGNIGNQLFQIAATVALALRNNDKYIFPPWKHESLFNLHNCFSGSIQYSAEYNEPFFHFKPIPYKPNLNLLGYFQSEKFFDDCKPTIKQLLTPVYSAPFREGVASIHVRRTDYLNFPNHHPVSSMSYYERAMDKAGVNRFLVFSDDIAWCKAHFIGNSFEFSEGQEPTVDIALQAKCEHNIICNSTFSWWAAWLNENVNKKVISPKTWFGPALSMHDTKDLIPDSWIRL